MRVFKFWRIAETTVLIDGVEKSISCFGGSNHSESDALNDGHQRLEAVKRRIAGTEKGKGPDYQADIRERAAPVARRQGRHHSKPLWSGSSEFDILHLRRYRRACLSPVANFPAHPFQRTEKTGHSRVCREAAQETGSQRFWHQSL
jgi:hypothetical protein